MIPPPTGAATRHARCTATRAVSACTRILKNGAPLRARRIPAVVHEADLRVREMVAEAGAQAERIRAQAEAGREHALALAAEEGHRRGLARAASILAAAAGERDRLLAATEREVVLLALAVSRKALGRELSDPSRAAVVDLAAHAILAARHRRQVTLRVSASDMAAARAHEGRLGALLAGGSLSLREDPSLEPGDVVVETESGSIDARVETQLAAIARELEEGAA